MRQSAFKSDDGSNFAVNDLESRADKVRKAWAFALWSPISRERQKTKKDSQCESFLLRRLSPARLIRCFRITSDEENINKLLRDARLRDFCDGELNYTGYESERLGPNHWTRITQGTRNESCGYSGKQNFTVRSFGPVSSSSTTQKRLASTSRFLYIL